MTSAEIAELERLLADYRAAPARSQDQIYIEALLQVRLFHHAVDLIAAAKAWHTTPAKTWSNWDGLPSTASDGQ